MCDGYEITAQSSRTLLLKWMSRYLGVEIRWFDTDHETFCQQVSDCVKDKMGLNFQIDRTKSFETICRDFLRSVHDFGYIAEFDLGEVHAI